MRRNALIVLLAAVLLAVPGAWNKQSVAADGKASGPEDPQALEQRAAQLRKEGPAALDKLLDSRQQLNQSLTKAKSPAETEALQKQAEQLDRLIDLVGGQRYCTASHLFWYTDLDAAKKVAQDTGKPILSLHMMGRLTDEFSCANSRFFRTTLYANETISKLMRERFVLHWKSVRPVPKVTIDFGDGRVLQRTLTGNSIHYVLDEKGRVLDGLPGLYSPQHFELWLNEMLEWSAGFKQANPQNSDIVFAARVKDLHELKLAEVVRAWQADVDVINSQDGNEKIIRVPKGVGNIKGGPGNPPANVAGEVARPKNDVERPLIAGVLGRPDLARAAQLMRNAQVALNTDDALWEKIAALHLAEIQLDQASLGVIRGQNPTAVEAAKTTDTKRKAEDPLVRMLAKLNSSIAVDTVRNEYDLHRRVHEWFTAGSAPRDVEQLNDKVYAELFLTPRSDPWIGLLPADVYSGLENNGVAPKK